MNKEKSLVLIVLIVAIFGLSVTYNPFTNQSILEDGDSGYTSDAVLSDDTSDASVTGYASNWYPLKKIKKGVRKKVIRKQDTPKEPSCFYFNETSVQDPLLASMGVSFVQTISPNASWDEIRNASGIWDGQAVNINTTFANRCNNRYKNFLQENCGNVGDFYGAITKVGVGHQRRIPSILTCEYWCDNVKKRCNTEPEPVCARQSTPPFYQCEGDFLLRRQINDCNGQFYPTDENCAQRNDNSGQKFTCVLGDIMAGYPTIGTCVPCNTRVCQSSRIQFNIKHDRGPCTRNEVDLGIVGRDIAQGRC